MRALLLGLTACSRLLPASDDPPAQHRDFTPQGATEHCTIGTRLEPRCMEVAGYPGSAKAVERGDADRKQILACYWALHLALGRSWQDASWATLEPVVKTRELALSTPSLAADPGEQDCLAIVDRESKGWFSYDVEMNAEWKRIAPTFSETFAAACKLDAKLVYNRIYDPFHVDVPVAPKQPNRAVAMSADRPRYEILCTGELRVHAPDGEATIPPTHSSDRWDANHEGCLKSCAANYDNADVCAKKGLAGHACQTFCTDDCKKYGM